MRRLLVALITLAVIGAAAPAQAHSATTSPLRLPPPTGAYPVGVRSASVTDPARIDEQTHRPRRLPVRIWYPAARAGHGPSARYLSPGAQDYVERTLGLSAGWLDVDTHAIANARPRGHLAGVVIVQHGGGTLAAFQTGQVIDRPPFGILYSLDVPVSYVEEISHLLRGPHPARQLPVRHCGYTDRVVFNAQRAFLAAFLHRYSRRQR